MLTCVCTSTCGLLDIVLIVSSGIVIVTDRVQMGIACALISLKVLPPKLNPVIRPLMETIKKENYHFFQVGGSGFTKYCVRVYQ